MKFRVLESLVSGFVSGLTEMLPISADAHRLLLQTIFGFPAGDDLFRLLCHLASFAMLFWLFQSDLRGLHQTARMMKTPPRRRSRALDPASTITVRLLRASVLAMTVVRLLTWSLGFIRSHLFYISVTLVLNGIVLLVPSLLPNGDRDSRNMPKIMGAVMGVAGGLGGIPGFSAMGMVLSSAVGCTVGRHYALKYACILAMPSLLLEAVHDLLRLVMGGIPELSGRMMAVALAGAALAALATRLGVRILRLIADRRGFDGFAYYCWGVALLCFILFLIV